MDDSISKTIGRNIRKHRISRKMTRESWRRRWTWTPRISDSVNGANDNWD